MSNPTYTAQDYQYQITWSEEDQIFIGRVMEFPLLAAHGESLEAALREIVQVVGFVLEDMNETNDPIPVPLSKQFLKTA